MLSLFRSSLPSRMLMVVLLGIVFSIVGLTLSFPLSAYYARILLDAHKVSEGHLLYRDVFDHAGPITVYLNATLEYLGISGISEGIAAVLILLNALFLNQMIDRYRLMEERTFVPALLALILGFSVYQTLELNGFLLGNIFCLLATSALFRMGEENADTDHSAFLAGTYIGIAVLCDQMFVLYMFTGAIAVFYYSPSVGKQLLILLMGLIFPVLVVLIVYLLFGAQGSLFHYGFASYFLPDDSGGGVGLMLVLPWIAVSVLSLLLYGAKRAGLSFKNYTSKAHQVMVVSLITAVLLILFVKERSFGVAFVLVNPTAFLVSFYLLKVQRRWLAESFTLLLLAFSLLFHFLMSYNPAMPKENIKAHQVYPSGKEYNASVLVLDYAPGVYRGNEHGSCFTNWRLEQKTFLNLNKKGHLERIYLGITKDYPEIIVDPNDIFSRVQERIPHMRKKYTRAGNKTYRLLKRN